MTLRVVPAIAFEPVQFQPAFFEAHCPRKWQQKRGGGDHIMRRFALEMLAKERIGYFVIFAAADAVQEQVREQQPREKSGREGPRADLNSLTFERLPRHDPFGRLPW